MKNSAKGILTAIPLLVGRQVRHRQHWLHLGATTHPVETRQPNGLGLYNMSGNVWEWCADRYDRGYYKQSPRTNPKGDPFGINRILRGGAASSKPGFLRASYRDYVAPTMRSELFGLRLVLDAPLND